MGRQGKRYVLRNKDIPLIWFTAASAGKWNAADVSIKKNTKIKVSRINETESRQIKAIFPAGIDENLLSVWLDDRESKMKNQDHVLAVYAQLKSSLGNSVLGSLDAGYGLSLNDTLWVIPEGSDWKWADYSLYRHPFNRAISRVAFTGHRGEEEFESPILAPELTTDGSLAKAWEWRGGIPVLKKRSRPWPDGRSDVVSEYYAAQIADVMALPHIEYGLEEYVDSTAASAEPICTCPLFTSERIGFCSAFEVFHRKQIKLDFWTINFPKGQRKLAHAYGRDAYADMMIYDSIIGNTDRHFANFGYLMDNDTGDLLTPAPLFDNGHSLLCDAVPRDLEDGLDDIMAAYHYSNGRFLHFDVAAALFVGERHMPMLKRLLDFHFRPHPACAISDFALDCMNQYVQRRAAWIMDIFRDPALKAYLAGDQL